MNRKLLTLVSLLAAASLSIPTLAQESDKQRAILGMIAALDADPPAFGLPPEGAERAAFKKWCEPLLAMKPPAVAPLLELLHCQGGESVMMAAFVMSENRWEAGARELLMLLDSEDQRLREAAQDVVAVIYAGWDEGSRKDFGAIDLARLLSSLHAQHGKLSHRIWQSAAMRVLHGEDALAGKDSLIPEEWFDMPALPAETNLEDPAAQSVAMKSPLWRMRYEAVGQADLETAPQLFTAALSDADARVILRACERIQDALREDGELSQPALLKASRSLTRHADARVRALALSNCGALAKRSPADLPPEIIEAALKDPEGAVREAAVEAFRDTRPKPLPEEDSRRMLLTAREDADLGVRCAAARAVKGRGSKAAKEELEKWFADDKSPLVRFLRQCVEDSEPTR